MGVQFCSLCWEEWVSSSAHPVLLSSSAQVSSSAHPVLLSLLGRMGVQFCSNRRPYRDILEREAPAIPGKWRSRMIFRIIISSFLSSFPRAID